MGRDEKSEEVVNSTKPEKYEKPKDHLFFDLFSMYTKNFVKQKKNESASH